MKRFFSLALVATALVFGLNSCSDSDSDYHFFGVTSQVSSSPIVYLYADQATDTLYVSSTDSWTGNTACDWLLFSGGKTISKDITYSYGDINVSPNPITIFANTTGAARTTRVQFDANGRTIGLQYVQFYWLNITEPSVSVKDTETFAGATFTKTVKATDTSTEIAFTIYTDATLSTTDSWITIPTTSFSKGSNKVTLNLQTNTSTEARTGTVTLTSAKGISTNISIIQQGKTNV